MSTTRTTFTRWLTLGLAAAVASAALVVGGASAAVAGEAETIYSALNQSRAAAGLGALNRNASLDAVAVGWANQMAASGTMAHNPAMSSQIPAGWSAAGENVAQGQPNGSAMNTAWYNSPGHRANMLGSYSDVGIAFVAAGGTTWGVEVFALYGSPPAPLAQAAPGAQAAPRSPGAPAVPSASEQAAAAEAQRAAEQAAAEQAAAEQAAAQLAAEQAAAELAAQRLEGARSAIDVVAASAADFSAGNGGGVVAVSDTVAADAPPVSQRTATLAIALVAVLALAALWVRRSRRSARETPARGPATSQGAEAGLQ